MEYTDIVLPPSLLFRNEFDADTFGLGLAERALSQQGRARSAAMLGAIVILRAAEMTLTDNVEAAFGECDPDLADPTDHPPLSCRILHLETQAFEDPDLLYEVILIEQILAHFWADYLDAL